MCVVHPVVGYIEKFEWEGVELRSSTRTVYHPVQMDVMICHADYRKLDPTKPIFIYQEDQ